MVGVLPGHTRALEVDGPCMRCLHDKGVTVLAVRELCTEADSMGAEWTPLCQDCLNEAEIAREEAANEMDDCEIGNHRALDVRPWRDPEEGSNGPVYMACAECRANAMREFDAGQEDWRDSDEVEED